MKTYTFSDVTASWRVPVEEKLAFAQSIASWSAAHLYQALERGTTYDGFGVEKEIPYWRYEIMEELLEIRRFGISDNVTVVPTATPRVPAPWIDLAPAPWIDF